MDVAGTIDEETQEEVLKDDAQVSSRDIDAGIKAMEGNEHNAAVHDGVSAEQIKVGPDRKAKTLVQDVEDVNGGLEDTKAEVSVVTLPPGDITTTLLIKGES